MAKIGRVVRRFPAFGPAARAGLDICSKKMQQVGASTAGAAPGGRAGRRAAVAAGGVAGGGARGGLGRILVKCAASGGR